MTVIALGDVQVSPAELLHRDDTPLHGDRARAQVFGRRVLVTGAGGSIGSEIVRQVNMLDPEGLYLLDHDENALHSVQLDLHGHGLLDTESTILADIREGQVIDRIMRDVRPDVVFHAAAHKHLPLLERYPSEGIRTNILGTANVVAAALKAGVSTFVNISTDKAASPSSVLGATKRLAELIVTSHAGLGMQVASVRFGNVLGSHGSFLRSLAFQVRRGIPVTVTDPDCTRFFMTIPEAAGLVIEASGMADHGEIYVLDMGDPVRILDIVSRYMHAIGGTDTPITFTGLRPGEKLAEELFDERESRRSTTHQRIWCVNSDEASSPTLASRAIALAKLDPATPAEMIHAGLFSLLPTSTVPELVAS